MISILMPYAAENFPVRQRGRATGWVAGCSKVGGVIAQGFAALALGAGLWSGCRAIAIPTVASLLLVAVFGHETRGRDLRELETKAGFKRLDGDRRNECRAPGCSCSFPWPSFLFMGSKRRPCPDQPWAVSPGSPADATALSSARPSLDPDRVYTLPDLVDIAERNNPETRVLWERAKQRATAAGVARSALFPTLAAVASASMNQYSLFFGKFYHEDTALFPAIVNLSYTVFDFGARRAKIDEARANLLAADFAFQRRTPSIRLPRDRGLLSTAGRASQEDAAQATSTDAQTVEEAVEARLANGLATLPDVLEARSATAQARYELASIQGLQAIARGGLATVLGASPTCRIPNREYLQLPAAAEQ